MRSAPSWSCRPKASMGGTVSAQPRRPRAASGSARMSSPRVRRRRQPRQVHPVPDGMPVRLHHRLPRRQRLRHRRRRAASPAADVVGELRRGVNPVRRPGQQQADRRTDATPAPAAQQVDPEPGAPGMARVRRADDGDRHPRRGQLGGTGARADRRPDHGHGYACAFQSFLLDRDERRTEVGFSLDTFSDKPFLVSTAVSVVLLVLSTVLGIFQAVLKTTRLDVGQWLICMAVALSVVVAAEIRKAARRRIAAKAVRPVPPANASQSRSATPAGAAVGSEHAARRGEPDHGGPTPGG